MWYRSSVILRSFIALVASVGWISLLFVSYFDRRWLGLGVVPICFLPAAIIAARLAQHLDVQRKQAFWIGVPTILAMILVTLFSFFTFSTLGERLLSDGLFAVFCVVALAAVITAVYVFAQRRAFEARAPR
jgi:hypothetical protein